MNFPFGFVNRSGYNEDKEYDEEFQYNIYNCYKSDGIVFACMYARQLVFTEARFQLQRMRKGRPGDLFGIQDLDIFEKPWPNATTGELLARAIQDADLGGNHYVVREGDRLRRLRPDWVDIILTQPPDKAVDSDVAGYVYMPGGRGSNPENWEIYPIDGSNGVVAHWCPIPDPDALYRGMSWLSPVIREINADKAATLHKAKFFENAATPNLAVAFKETVTNEQFKEFMESMDSLKGGVEHAYETLYLGGGADVTVVGADLRQMDFKATQGAGETRIAAAARIPPVFVGLSEGMQGSSLNAGNFTAAKHMFGDSTMRPLWRSVCAAYEPLLKGMPKDARLWYDDRDIAFLRDDRTTIAEMRKVEAGTISVLIQSGYEPQSIIQAIKQEDWDLLSHTGLFSVQLQPPGEFNAEANTIQALISAGFTHDSVIAAIQANNLKLLKKEPNLPSPDWSPSGTPLKTPITPTGKPAPTTPPAGSKPAAAPAKPKPAPPPK
jgi:phage portal protein BeeE